MHRRNRQRITVLNTVTTQCLSTSTNQAQSGYSACREIKPTMLFHNSATHPRRMLSIRINIEVKSRTTRNPRNFLRTREVIEANQQVTRNAVSSGSSRILVVLTTDQSRSEFVIKPGKSEREREKEIWSEGEVNGN